MFNKIISILLLAIISCKDKQTAKQLKRVDELQQPTIVDNSENKGFVKWIRDEGKDRSTMPATIKRFIGKGRKPIYSVKGDINNDDREDFIVVTAIQNEDDLLLDTVISKRELLLLIAGENETFKIANRSENAVPCINCYGMSHDAFAGIKTETGRFTLLFFGGSNWKDTRASTFVFDEKKQDWYLENEIKEHFFMNYQNYEVDTLTKKDFGIVPLSKFNIYKIYKID